MGGGPRTFPGGINKWQWKRMHEKKAKEKERKLLDQEKELYQARIRSQIRANVAGGSMVSQVQREGNTDSSSSDYNPMSAKDHVKALADRFMKEGAEDLWNEDDGPVNSSPPTREIERSERRSQSVDSSRTDYLGKMFNDGRSLVGNRQNLDWGNESLRPRYYSVQARQKSPPRFRLRKYKNSSSDDDESDYSSEEESLIKPPVSNSKFLVGKDGGKLKFSKFKLSQRDSDQELDSKGGKFVKMAISRATLPKSKFPKFNFSEGESEEEVNSKVSSSVKKVTGRATLGKHDMKKTRLSPRMIDENCGLSEQVELIREELKRRKSPVSLQEEVEQEGGSLLSNKRFDECNISPLTVKSLTSAGYIQMTKVQEATLSVCLDGVDALVKAKTGTGKSAAFLLPAIETVLNATSSSRNTRAPPILVLILCPTRELASQIAAEANVLLKYHDGIGVQTLIGGTRFKVDQRRLESDPCQIMVATPGRLLDHIENNSGFSIRLMGLKMLIVDEADHLLDLGFRKDIEKIVDCVPRERQSLLLSATIPKEVRRVSQLVLKRGHAFIDTVLGDIETHEKVKQSYYVASHELHFQVAYQLLKDHISKVVDYKVIVFCTTSMVTSLMFQLLLEMKLNVREMHSRKPQLYRTRISDEFRESKRLILVTSDISARGMNYPDVTLVLQVGIPTDREQYIHRLGRTGREGKEGEGILLLAPWEEYFLDEIKDLPIAKSSSMQLDSDIKLKVQNTLVNMDSSVKEAAYHAWLGYYNSIRDIGRDKTTLVELANQFCDSIGLQKPPSLFRKTAVKMGLRNIPGIRIRK
ncbi:Atp-dependent rna helicase [Thalictrum thalictroides]|uniref:ATP-dependent RNA helicase n=1 Tax=Thalictrum thalictroides TaxID=46969 RepID=A0A7J6X5L6_THATH|nr:Atp-dependent rna helicase [Thalictrum thalictroides]